CSDAVHRDILSRFANAEERADRLLAFYMRRSAEAVPSDRSRDKLVVFNTLPFERDEPIEAEVTTRWPAFQLVDGDGKAIDFEVVDEREVDPGLVDRQLVQHEN